MKNKQNERIMQISEKTLVVGIDIGSETHYARAFDFRGIELGKLLRFSDSIEGYEVFQSWVKDLQELHKKNHIIAGMEPTGHYWFCIGEHLKASGIKIGLVNPLHVKRSKELDDNSQSKSDRKDPKVIAGLINAGRYSEPYMPEGIYRDMRIAVSIRSRLQKKEVSVSNSVQRWLKIYFPEFTTVFKDWQGKGALMSLRNFATPDKVIELGESGIVECWRSGVKRAVGAKHAVRLVAVAKRSSGVKEGLKLARFELSVLLDEYELIEKQLVQTETMIEELLMQIPNASKLLSIKGIGISSVASFIASVGDISRFDHPNQIKKLLGLSLVENSSGKHKGRTVLSKRGRKDGRRALFNAIIPVLARNEEFRQMHRYYTQRAANPLKKMQSAIALCSKLIRIFFKILKTGVDYDPCRMLCDIQRPLQSAA